MVQQIEYIYILGNPAGFSDFTNGGKMIVSRQQISDLLSHSDNQLTIGVDKESDNMLYELPSWLFTTPVVINRLDYNFQETNTINGIYHSNGLQEGLSRETFLLNLSVITGISVEDLTRESFGSNTVDGIVPIVWLYNICSG